MSARKSRISRVQAGVEESARPVGYYVAGVYREKASGARVDRPELQCIIGDLQPGEVVLAEKINRISRLPLPEAEKLVDSIRAKGTDDQIRFTSDFASELLRINRTALRLYIDEADTFAPQTLENCQQKHCLGTVSRLVKQAAFGAWASQ